LDRRAAIAACQNPTRRHRKKNDVGARL